LPNTIIGWAVLGIVKTGSAITITEFFIGSSYNFFVTICTAFFLHRLEFQKGQTMLKIINSCVWLIVEIPNLLVEKTEFIYCFKAANTNLRASSFVVGVN
jgi:hypothetical protein